MTNAAVRCATCGAVGTGPDAVRLDLDMSTTPPEYVCLRCKRKPRCTRCGKRRNRLTIEPGADRGTCSFCLRRAEQREVLRCRRTCSACHGATSVELTNDHGECPSCTTERLYREHPIRRSAS